MSCSNLPKSYVVPGLHESGQRRIMILCSILSTNISQLSQQVVSTKQVPRHLEEELRNLGHELTAFSETLLKKERENVNEIINHNILMLIGSLAGILLFS